MRPCPGPHCGRPITKGKWCDRCATKREQLRGSAADRGYTHMWADYARQWLHRFPWCGQRVDGKLYADHSRCVQHAIRTRADCVDHITPIRSGGSVFHPTNHQSLCRACNSAKG